MSETMDPVEPAEVGKESERVYRYPAKSNLKHSQLSQSSSALKTIEQVKKAEEEVARDQSLLWELMGTYLGGDVPTIQRQISDHVEYTLARDRSNFDTLAAYQATAYSVRDRLIEYWNDSNFRFTELNPKRVYYMSIEYLLGRSLGNSLLNLGIDNNYTKALKQLGYQMEDLYDREVDAGLGNGGLGRLAACYLDSLASQNYCAWGYGLRYTYGMFKQEIFQGFQAEIPDLWLKEGNPWEVTRLDIRFPVRFGGETLTFKDADGKPHSVWEGGEVVIAVAHDTPIPGYRTTNTLNLRLWSSEPTHEFDLSSFNEGNYYKAIEKRQKAEALSSVLYPNDSTEEGKTLRLKQQYFFACATIQDILRRYKKRNTDLHKLPEKVSIQLNDTHPTISIPELMRVLIDEEGMEWSEAEAIVIRVFSYTNHTVLPEAMECWPIPLLEAVLPRHLQIIYEINHLFLKFVQERLHIEEDDLKMRGLSIVQESNPKMIRMANLAIVMSHKVNGVAHIHTEILKNYTFKPFTELYPEKFVNVTNGITPRRWLYLCNPNLTHLIQRTLGVGDEFINNLECLSKLREHADNVLLQEKWMAIRMENKKKLCQYLKDTCKVEVDPTILFDVQIKRIHEYKRQLMNILRCVHLYRDMQRKALINQLENIQPRLILFGGKAAPGYKTAKAIIKLINSVAERVNNDPKISKFLKIVFVPNYNVSLAEMIIPATDLSEHISTAGTEASGTSNMKFALNGGLIIGTLDGANVEIQESVGPENIFIFGLTADQVGPTRGSNGHKHTIEDPRMQDAVNSIRNGDFGDPSPYNALLDSLIPSRDHYLLGADFAPYLNAHLKVDRAFQNKAMWARMSIASTSGMGKFSSDRCIHEYAKKIWGVEPIKVDVRSNTKPFAEKEERKH